jgi:RHS repeat-associated protein
MRGWLNNINNPNDLVTGKDLFGMTLAYDNVGNITTWNYQNAQINAQNKAIENRGLYAYAFSYDGLNRLQTSNLAKAGITMFSNTQNYDLNGNVLALQRTFNGTIVDNMAYTYQGINKLGSITDSGTNPTIGEFFKDGTANYTYDANGNLKTDSGKNISNITYNYMNLVSTVTQNNNQSTYTYASNGQKLSANLGAFKKYDYIANAVYKNDTLEFIATAEGRFVPPLGARGLGFEYTLKDHLGNARISCGCDKTKGTLTVLQENHYDPWGLSLPIGLEGNNRFTYNSKEKQDGTGWLDYGARMYDPAKVVWNGVDALSEKMRRFSPTVYANDNPIRFIDPDGMSIEEHSEKNKNEGLKIWDGPRYFKNEMNSENELPIELQFDKKGNYKGQVDDGQKEYSGAIVDNKGNKEHFEFNDQKDAEGVLKGTLSLSIDFSKKFNLFLSKAQVEPKNIFNRFFYALKQSLYHGNIDFVHHIASMDIYADKKLYLAGKTAYNLYDANNFLWGMSMQKLGFDYSSAKMGSEVNAFFNSKRQNLEQFPWYAPWLGITPKGDTAEDQNAIINGYFWNKFNP